MKLSRVPSAVSLGRPEVEQAPRRVAPDRQHRMDDEMDAETVPVQLHARRCRPGTACRR